MNKEIWKDIPGWQDFYQASNRGHIRSINRTVKTSRRESLTKFKGKVLNACKIKNGYLMVSLTAPSRQLKHAYVHDLVLVAFKGPKPKSREACHNNGDKTDNKISNLRYDTRSANAQDRNKHGTIISWKGEGVPSAKLTEKKVLQIRKLAKSVSMRELGRRYSVCHKTIGAVIHRESWAHI